MKILKVFSNYNQTIAATGGTYRWNLSFLPSKIGNLFPHVVGIIPRFVSGVLADAASGPTIAGADYGALVSSVTLARNTTDLQIDHVGLDSLLHREAVKAGGIAPMTFPAQIAAGGSTTFANTDFPVTFLEPLAANDNDLCWPTAAYNQAGFVELVIASPAALDSHLSYSTAPTMTIVVLVMLKKEPQIPADVRIGQWVDTINVAANAVRSGLMFPAGKYRRVFLDSPAAGYPIPAAANYSAIESLNQTAKFPLGMGMAAADYNGMHLLQSASPNAVVAGNIVGNNTVAVLVSPAAAAGKATESTLYASSDVNFKLTVGGTAVASHRFVFERVYARDKNVAGKVAAQTGVSTRRAALATADGTPTGDPSLMPVVLK